MRILFYRFTADTIEVESQEIGFRKRYFFFLSEGLRKIFERELHNEELNNLCTSFFFLWHCDPARVMASSFLRFLDHTRRTTVGRPPLDE